MRDGSRHPAEDRATPDAPILVGADDVVPGTGSSSRSHRADVDLVRVLGALAIVTIHVTGPFIAAGVQGATTGLTYWMAEIAGAASRVGVAAFFALAGWAFLTHRPDPDDAGFLARRLRRLVLPLVAWSFIYIAQNVVLSTILGRPAWPASLGFGGWLSRELSWLAFGPGVKYHLWFLYFLIAALVVMWLARSVPPSDAASADPASASRAWMRYGIVAVGTLLMFGLASVFGIRLTWVGFGWVVGYAALGYALFEGPHPRRAVGLAIYVVAVLVTAVLGRLVGYNLWPYFNQGPLAVLATIGFFWALRSTVLSPTMAARFDAAAGLTFGIYLAHPLVLDYLRLAVVRQPLLDLPGPLRLAIVWIVTVVVTTGLVWAWHRSRRLVDLLG